MLCSERKHVASLHHYSLNVNILFLKKEIPDFSILCAKIRKQGQTPCEASSVCMCVPMYLTERKRERVREREQEKKREFEKCWLAARLRSELHCLVILNTPQMRAQAPHDGRLQSSK